MKTQNHNKILVYCHVLFMTGIRKSFTRRYTNVPVVKRSRFPVGQPKGAGLVLGGDTYFNFEFSLLSHSLQIDRALANEIKHF